MTTTGGLTETELDEGGLTITTTIDRGWQRAAVDAVRDLPEDRPEGLHVAVVSLDPSTGAIRALYGGDDYIERQQNAVTQDVAQAGSTFKPIALAAALATGEHSLGDWYSGRSPMRIADWEVENIGGTSYRDMTLLRATQDSVNTVYAQLNEEIGGETTRRTAVEMGIPADTLGLDADLTNVLGTASPHPLDVAVVYATLAGEGVRHEPHIVSGATDPSERVVYQGPTRGERVLDADTAAEVTYALTQVVEQGTGTKALDLGRPAAAKTGTSEEHRSAWFVGYTPQVATAVAFYQEGPGGSVAELTPFGGVSEVNGGVLPAQVWVDLMAAEHEDLAVEEFPERPDGGSGSTSRVPPAEEEPAPSPTPDESDDARRPEPSDSAWVPDPTAGTDPGATDPAGVPPVATDPVPPPATDPAGVPPVDPGASPPGGDPATPVDPGASPPGGDPADPTGGDTPAPTDPADPGPTPTDVATPAPTSTDPVPPP
jgi:membrane peptidoglycan carboxypeptidase